VPPLTSRLPDTADHLDRCWLEVQQKRELRQRGDQIGLRTKETVTS
jgi:hypothetical protein